MDETHLPIDYLYGICDRAGIPVTGEAQDLTPLVLDSLSRTLRRVQRSQHRDGGWGPQVEQSNFWHTAYAVLFLRAMRNVPVQGEPVDPGEMLPRGVAYLERHPERWAADVLSVVPGISNYEIGLMGRCFYRVGRAYVRRESALRIYRSIDRLYHSQNEDGGWDANLWGYEVKTPTYVWSEVGATSMVLQALAEAHEERFAAVVRKGMQWLAASQNPDGSWNNGSCHPGSGPFQLSGWPAVNKTCDALQGILAGQLLEIPLEPFGENINRGVRWLCGQVQPILGRFGQAGGHGGGFSIGDYEAICMTLETLLWLPDAPMPELSAYVTWLLSSQRRQTGDVEDGSWIMGHTARIGLALAQYYWRSQGKQTQPTEPEPSVPWFL
jgi:hypothetical protein